MRILLDECVPRRLRAELTGHDVHTVPEMGWSGKKNGELLVNEINTLPGLTDVSGFPKMWEATGIPFSQVIDQLIEMAIERHNERARNETSI